MTKFKILFFAGLACMLIGCKDTTRTTDEGGSIDQSSGYTEEELDNRGGQSQTDAPDTSATQRDRTEEGSIETQ